MARINSRTWPGPSNTPAPGSDDTIDSPCLSTLNEDGPYPGIVGTMPAARTPRSTPACWCGRGSTQRQGSRPARRLRPEWPAGSIWTNQANGPSSGQRTRSYTGQPPAPGRRLIDAGVSIALASGADPGTSYTSSMNLVVALGVLRCGLTPAEAVHAATAGGARALRRTDVGMLTVGARADLHVLNAPSHAYLAYRPGMPLTHSVYQHGTRVT